MTKSPLTEEKKKMVEKFYKYTISATKNWAVRNEVYHMIDELISEALWTLVKCVRHYSNEVNSSDFGFKSYLKKALDRNLIRVVFVENGYRRNRVKDRKENESWIKVFYEIDEELFKNVIAEIPDEVNGREEFDFIQMISQSRLLSELDKEILIEIFIHEKSLADIAREKRVTREYIRQRKERALNILRKVIMVNVEK